MRPTLTREMVIPKPSTKIADKLSDAVAYIYERNGNPCAAIFVGKGAKPVERCFYRSAASREASIRRHFEGRRLTLAFKAQQATEAKAKAESFRQSVEIGDIFYTAWGYDQTTVDFYEVVGISGKMATLRPIGLASEDLGYDWRYKCVPQSGAFMGEATRHLIQSGYVRIGRQYASKWNTSRIAGVPVGRAVHAGGCH